MRTKAAREDRSRASHDQAAECRENGRFLRFNLRQILLLVALVSVLLGILTPRIRRTFHLWHLEENARRQGTANSDLTAGVRINDVALARQALEEGADPNLWLRSQDGRLFSTCVAKGQVEMMELLLDYGAEIEQIDRAAQSNQPAAVRCRMIRLLVARGADPRESNAMDTAVRLPDAEMGDLLREYGLPYGPREMASFNRLDELKRVVIENPDVVQERFRQIWAGSGPTLLAIALEHGYREMALFLLGSGAPLDVLVYEGSTLLHMAARGGDPELIRLLIARGLDVNATDSYSDTPLSDIAGRKKPQAVAALLAAGADVNWHGINRRTPLYGAVSSDHVDIVRMLLAAGADPTLGDYQGTTPLDMVRGQRTEIAHLLQEAAAKRTGD